MKDLYDVLVAGGGAAGALTAARLSHNHPELTIALLEKEPMVGGRLRRGGEVARGFYSGFGVSKQLFEFIDQMLKADPEAADLHSMEQGRIRRVGALAAGTMRSVDADAFFSKKGARILGGLAAQKEWAQVDEIVSTDATDELGDEDATPDNRNFGQVWDKPRKHPASVALEHIAAAVGVPDLWAAEPRALRDRARPFATGLYAAAWNEVFPMLFARSDGNCLVDVLTDCRIIGAKHDKESDTWEMATEKGPIRGKSLVVAMPPWQAAFWLPRDQWPSTVHPLISKTKPVSVVTLTDRVVKEPADDAALPDMVLVPSEGVQVYRYGGEICFQATIDYEMTLQAPTVVKAIKRLKRARKKLLAFCSMELQGEHIALIPVGWAQSPLSSDKRWLAKLEKGKHNSKALAFAGDAYGGSYDGDENTITSLIAACEAVCPTSS